MDYWDGKGRRAGFDPVFAELVAMARMHWLDGVADRIEESVEGGEGPAMAAEGFPDGGVVGEGPEGY